MSPKPTRAPDFSTVLRIAIAEDDEDTRHILEIYWTGLGHEVTAFDNGAALVAHLVDAGEAADLVILDVMMPVLDGVGAARALRAAPATRALPIVCLSAKADHLRAAAMGLFDAFVTKPFTLRTLQSYLASALAAD
jgi:CheY-like chemotaxis protein